MIYTMYDPPSGWQFGFPKPYLPLTPGEPIEDTLRRDGYPESLMSVARYTRFWKQEIDE